jgi:hypothetical protein
MFYPRINSIGDIVCQRAFLCSICTAGKITTFTPTVVIVPEVLEADSANTPVPDIEVTVSSVNTDIYSVNDEYLVVLYALIPVVILLVVVLLVARNQK